MRELEGLKEIYNNYDTFIIDLWGVMHNGIMLNPRAIEAVENLQKNSKKFVFLSNAPRPSVNVVDFLLKMKMVALLNQFRLYAMSHLMLFEQLLNQDIPLLIIGINTTPCT